MGARARRTATQRLTGSELVLSMGARPPGLFRQVLWFVLALCLGAAGAQWLELPLARFAPLAPFAAFAASGSMAGGSALEGQRQQELQRSLEQARLDAGLSQARSRELERQIDNLNQQLREAQEQLLFYRKAQQGRH